MFWLHHISLAYFFLDKYDFVKCTNVNSSWHYAPLCGVLYKEEGGYLVPLSVTDPVSNMNSFTWYKEENDWIVPEEHYNEEFKNWRGPIHNGWFRLYNFKEKRNTEDTCTKYVVSAKFNGIPREGKPSILIKP